MKKFVLFVFAFLFSSISFAKEVEIFLQCKDEETSKKIEFGEKLITKQFDFCNEKLNFVFWNNVIIPIVGDEDEFSPIDVTQEKSRISFFLYEGDLIQHESNPSA